MSYAPWVGTSTWRRRAQAVFMKNRLLEMAHPGHGKSAIRGTAMLLAISAKSARSQGKHFAKFHRRKKRRTWCRLKTDDFAGRSALGRTTKTLGGATKFVR